MNTITVDTNETRSLVEKQILEMINEVYFVAQERYRKLPKSAQVALDKLVDDSTRSLLLDINDYRKEPFNEIFPNLKNKDIQNIKTRAKLILDFIRLLDVTIKGRAYNLLRFIVTNY